MLDVFRSAAQTWIVKALFAILALSFVAWGVGDYTHSRGMGTGPAITVGSVDVSGQEVEEEFKRDFQRMQAQFGGKVSIEDARRMGFLDNTIETIKTRLLVNEAARQLGLTVSDATIIRAVASNPDLKNEQGQVDRERLRAALARMGMTEQTFLKVERENQTRNQLALAFTAGTAAPNSLVQILAKRRFEERVADLVTVPDTAVATPTAPSDADVEAYYKTNNAQFMAPEYRALTVLLLRPADVDTQIQVSDEDIQGAYDQHRAEFVIPERRQASQLLLTDQAQADKAGALVSQGRDITAIAKELNAQILDLGTVSESEVPTELAEPVFNARPGTTVGPTRSELGWHVVKVYRVYPGETKKLESVKSQLIEELHKGKTTELLADLSTKVEDALGGGASIEEAASKFGLKTVKIPAIDKQGLGNDGKAVTQLPKASNFLDLAFQIDQGTESQLTDNGVDGSFLVRVDGVTPPAAKPLALVKPQVVAAITAERRHADAKKKAEAIVESLKSGSPLSAIDKSGGVTVKTSNAFTRDGKGADDVPPALVGQVFDKNAEGDVALSDTPKGWVVARLAQIKPVDLTAKAEQVKGLSQGLAQAISSDVSDELLAAYRDRIGVKVDRSQVSREE